MRRILVLDNYDSFTYNLVHAIEKLTDDPVDVYRNDEIAIDEIDKYDKIVLSPGPGIPDEAGILKELISTYAPKKSIFGVCLGQQAIAEVFGGQLENIKMVYHGVSSNVKILQHDSLFDGIPEEFEAGRYHSWIVSKTNLPKELTITVEDEEGKIMGLSHKEYDVKGVQFHPESVLTPHGEQIIQNWLNA